MKCTALRIASLGTPTKTQGYGACYFCIASEGGRIGQYGLTRQGRQDSDKERALTSDLSSQDVKELLKSLNSHASM